MAERQQDLHDRAAVFVDGAFRSAQQDLVREHLRQEKRILAFHKGQLESFARNRELAEQRYVQRMQRIERGYQRAALAVDKRHNSLAGRLERLTKAGRVRQQTTLEALEERRAKLERTAGANFRRTSERQSQAEQCDRISRARELKLFRQDHLDARQQHRDHHEATRDIKIEVQVEKLRRAAEQNLRQQMQQLRREQEGHRVSR